MIGYFDFPRCREAFARGQKDARPVEIEGCYFRLRGRTKNRWTLLSFDDADNAYRVVGNLLSKGEPVQSLNYTAVAPATFARRGPTEWVIDDFQRLLTVNGIKSKKLRWALRRGCTVEIDQQSTLKVFEMWRSWAADRHFMVFTGHYLKWIKMFYENPGNTCLVGVKFQGNIEGIFGYERFGDVYQITVAKHTPRLLAQTLWANGLNHIGGNKIVLCGSTADALKHNIGMRACPSWMFDIPKICASLAPQSNIIQSTDFG